MAQPRYRLSRSIIYGYFPQGSRWLLIVNTVIFVIWYLGGPTVQGLMSPAMLVPMLVVHSFPWYIFQLFTYMFLHGSIGHLLFNMLALWMFGLPLEQTWGTRRFLKYYFLCGIGAGICDTAVNVLLGHNSSTIGASGAIYGLLLAFGVLFPDTQVLMYFLFPIKAKYLVMIYGGVELLTALGSGNSGVSNVAHLGGMLFGLLYLKVPIRRGTMVSAGLRGSLPAVEDAARQEEIPGLHAQARWPRTLGELIGTPRKRAPVPLRQSAIVTSESKPMRASISAVVCAIALVVALAGMVVAQEQGPVNPSSGTVAKKKPTDPGAPPNDGDLPKIPSEYTKKDKIDVGRLQTFKTDVDTVTVDVAVMDNKGRFIPDIPKTSFRVLEDNVPQQVTGFSKGEAPMTIAMVIEFSNVFQQYWGRVWYETLQLSWGFASTLKPEDYVAVIAYDIKPEILSDFTTNRMETQQALGRLQIPAWREANLFDAVADTAERMSGIEGRKAILLLSTGVDTFSKLTYDKARKSLQEAGVPVYVIGLMQELRLLMGPAGDNIGFLQADNQLKTFASETGGQAYFPRFVGEFGGIFQQIHQSLRSQYVLTYSPSNKAHDGSYRKIKVQLVDHDGNPVAMKDEKGKPMKYSVIAKQGYKAPRPVE